MTDTIETVVKRLSSLPSHQTEQIKYFDFFLEENRSSFAYRKNTMKLLITFCRFIGSKALRDVTKEDIRLFLKSKEKSIEDDPEQKWITTYNDYLGRLKMFFRWMYNKDRDVQREEWITPACADVRKIKNKRLSVYSPSDIWVPEEVLLAVRFCSSTRDKALITTMYDLAGRNHEVTKLRIKDVVFSDNYAEAMTSWDTKTGQRPIPLILSYTYLRNWLNEHPYNTVRDFVVFPSLTTWKPLSSDAIWKLCKTLKEKIQNVVQDGKLSEKEILQLKSLLQKPWNPYLMGRHSSLTEKAGILPEFSLRKYAGWSATSKQPARYVHLSGREVKTKLLEHYGLVKEEECRVQTAKECPRCKHLNSMEARFCGKCTLALTIDAWQQSRADIENLSKRMDNFEVLVRQILAGNPNPIPPDFSR